MAPDISSCPTGPAVVVVNDDNMQLSMLGALLKKVGLRVQLYQSAEAALAEMLQAEPPDLIITDLFMPGIDGWRFCRLLRSPDYASFNQIPILVVSATFSGEEPSRISTELGANGFLAMPVDGALLLQTVNDLLRGIQPQLTLRALIVDEDLPSAQRIAAAFRPHGFSADVAVSLGEAADCIARANYEIVVLGYRLPDGTGDQLLGMIRARSANCVLAMTSSEPKPELALQWMKMGASLSLQAPFEAEYLVAQCERARRERSLLRVQDLLEFRTQQLQESEQKFKDVFEAANVAKSVTLSTGVINVNQAFCDMLGYSREELRNKRWQDLTPAEDIEAIQMKLAPIYSGQADTARFTKRYCHKNGSIVWADVSVAARRDENGQVRYFITTLVDITERKRAEEALAHSHHLMRYVIEHSRSAIAVLDRDLKFIYISQRFLREYKVKEQDAIGRHHYDVFPDLPQRWREVHQKALAGEISSAEDDPYVREDGQTDWTRWECRPWYETSGLIGGIIVYTEVITERRQIEQQLRESEEKYRLIVENQQDLLVKTDPEGRYLYLNPAYCQLMNKTEQELLGKPFSALVRQPGSVGGMRAINALFRPPYEYACEEQVETVKGARWLSWRIRAYLDERGAVSALTGSGRDITERKEAEAKIQEQLDELRRWHNITLGREDRIIELKREVNKLMEEAGMPPKYSSALEITFHE